MPLIPLTLLIPESLLNLVDAKEKLNNSFAFSVKQKQSIILSINLILLILYNSLFMMRFSLFLA